MRIQLLITVLVFYSLAISAQNNTQTFIKSDVKTEKKIDPFNNSKIIETEYWKLFGKSEKRKEISGNIKKDGNEYYINLVLFSNIGCIKENSTSLFIKLSSDDIIECKHIGTVCGRNPNMLFKLNSIDKLKSYNWTAIRIKGTDSYVDVRPNKYLSKSEQFFRLHLIAIDRQ